MGEFFVARKYRRLGVATKAVGEILRQYPGHWEVAVAERNLAATAFWPRALTAAPSACQPVLLRVTVRIGAGQSGASERLIEFKSTTSMLLAVRPLCRDSNAAGHTLTAVEISKEFLRLIVEDSCCSEPHAIHARGATVWRALLALRRIKRRLLADYEGDAQRASLPVDKKQGSYRSGYRDLADQ